MALNRSPEFKRSNPKPSAAELFGIGHEPDMVYLPPRGSFVDHDFLKA